MANHNKRGLTSSSFESYWLKIFQLKGAPLSQNSRHWLPQDNQNPQSRSFLLFHFSKAFISKVFKYVFIIENWKELCSNEWLLLFFLFCFLLKKEYLHHVASWNLFSVDPPSVEQVQNLTVMEDTHVTKECNVTTGTPPINIFWEDVKSGQVFEGKLLNITDITRYQTEYRCIANNTCGWVSATMFIGVHCKNLHIFFL